MINAVFEYFFSSYATTLARYLLDVYPRNSGDRARQQVEEEVRQHGQAHAKRDAYQYPDQAPWPRAPSASSSASTTTEYDYEQTLTLPFLAPAGRYDAIYLLGCRLPGPRSSAPRQLVLRRA